MGRSLQKSQSLDSHIESIYELEGGIWSGGQAWTVAACSLVVHPATSESVPVHGMAPEPNGLRPY